MKYEFFNSTIQGIGCIAKEDIVKGEVVSREPYFAIPNYLYQDVFLNYCWSGDIVNLKNLVLINGLGFWCNHSDDNNLYLKKDKDNKFVLFIANKNIKKGEELFVTYGDNWWKSRNIQKKNLDDVKENKKRKKIKKKIVKKRFRMLF